MLRIIQAQAANALDVLGRQGRKQEPDIGDLICDVMLAEDVTCNHARLAGSGNICYVGRENGVAIVGPTVAGEESNETLGLEYVSWARRSWRSFAGARVTEKAGMI